jgi:hypothetical protein
MRKVSYYLTVGETYFIEVTPVGILHDDVQVVILHETCMVLD